MKEIDPTAPTKSGGSFWRTALINLIVFFCLLGGMEIAARIYIAWVYGSQTAGLQQRTQYLSYRPFVMYGPDWDNRLGSRTKTEAGVCRVMLVGGSTAANFPIDILERALSLHYSKKFEVINAAYDGYGARQEVVVAALWGPRLEPHFLLSLDGANDLEHRLRVSKSGGFYLSSTFQTFLTHPLLAPFYYLASQSQMYNAMQRLLARRNVGSAEQYADAIPIFINAQKSLNDLARGMGIARLMVLQPFSAYKIPLSKEEADFTLFKYREEVIKALYAKTNEQLSAMSQRDAVPYLDSRFIYNNVAGHIFTDDVHLTPEGYRRLAEAIAAAMAAFWPAQCAS